MWQVTLRVLVISTGVAGSGGTFGRDTPDAEPNSRSLPPPSPPARRDTIPHPKTAFAQVRGTGHLHHAASTGSKARPSEDTGRDRDRLKCSLFGNRQR